MLINIPPYLIFAIINEPDTIIKITWAEINPVMTLSLYNPNIHIDLVIIL